jgi:hypothetical protein
MVMGGVKLQSYDKHWVTHLSDGFIVAKPGIARQRDRAAHFHICLLPISYFLFPTSYFLLPASCFLLPASCFLP